jgi:type IV pilus assembly protein PilM
MLKSKSFLGVDFGAGSLKIAEFAATPQSGLRLIRFAVRPLGLAGSQDAARDNVIKKALGELLAEGGFLARSVNFGAPGYQVFSKFVKLPPVDTSKVTQIIQYEAQQNVPFPLAETAWDYQILGSNPGGELEVLLVAVKSDIVEKLFAAGEGAGLKMSVIDSSVGALANSFRYNYADQEGCSLLIDIGAKTSNVLLFEANKYYARSVNIGANAITQEFAAEAKLRFDDAEKFKKEHGFVSLGGAYEEPEDPRQAAISKVARNVLTRLHLQVNQTIQFYRTQQGGSAPARVFLCGGGSSMAYAAEFFQEKLSPSGTLRSTLRSTCRSWKK